MSFIAKALEENIIFHSDLASNYEKVKANILWHVPTYDGYHFRFREINPDRG